jgi:hypothetical protein
MCASLQNKFSNYRKCLLRFDIKENIIIKAFASLRFDNLVICLWYFWTCLHYRGMCSSWRCLHHKGLSCIWTCLHYRGVYCSWRCLPQGLSCIWTCLQYRGLCCFWRCLHYRGLSCIWTCLHYRVVYCSWRCLPQGLSCIWTCLHYRGMCLIHRDQYILTVERVRFALKIICLLSTVFASLQK